MTAVAADARIFIYQRMALSHSESFRRADFDASSAFHAVILKEGSIPLLRFPYFEKACEKREDQGGEK